MGGIGEGDYRDQTDTIGGRQGEYSSAQQIGNIGLLENEFLIEVRQIF